MPSSRFVGFDNHEPSIVRARQAAEQAGVTPHALAKGGAPVGAFATEAALREVASAGGLPHFRRAAEKLFNRVFEARR
jgi:hypothetical protein